MTQIRINIMFFMFYSSADTNNKPRKKKMSLLEQKLTKEWALKVIPPEKKMFGAILFDLQEMGKRLAKELDLKDYESFEQFLKEHEKGESALAKLEGLSDAEGHVFVLKNCPMGKLLNSLKGPDGKLPKYYLEVVDKYKALFKSRGAIIHPFCIVHQVIRAQIGEGMKAGGNAMLVYQVSCRSLTSGKTVYAEEGTSRTGLSKEEIDRKIDGKACMYLVKV